LTGLPLQRVDPRRHAIPFDTIDPDFLHARRKPADSRRFFLQIGRPHGRGGAHRI